MIFSLIIFSLRLAEEDDRMAAILQGEDGEDKKKTYESGFSSSISSDSGALDVAALANPNAPAATNNISSSSPAPVSSKEFPPVAPIMPASSNIQLLPESAVLSPPQSAESSPNIPRLSATAQASFDQDSCYNNSGSISSPPMGVGQVGVAYSPPSSVLTHSPGSVGSTGSPQFIRNDYQTCLVSHLNLSPVDPY